MSVKEIYAISVLIVSITIGLWFWLKIMIGVFKETRNQLKSLKKETKESWGSAGKLIVKIKRVHPDAKIPKYAKQGDAGLDLTAVDLWIEHDSNYVYDTGLRFEIPDGYVGLLFPRSSNSKTGLTLTNCVGVLDSGFRGRVTFKFKALWGHDIKPYEKGDRVGQIIILPYPSVQFEEVEELSETERGEGGYGSTGS